MIFARMWIWARFLYLPIMFELRHAHVKSRDVTSWLDFSSLEKLGQVSCELARMWAQLLMMHKSDPILQGFN